MSEQLNDEDSSGCKAQVACRGTQISTPTAAQCGMAKSEWILDPCPDAESLISRMPRLRKAWSMQVLRLLPELLLQEITPNTPLTSQPMRVIPAANSIAQNAKGEPSSMGISNCRQYWNAVKAMLATQGRKSSLDFGQS